MFVRKLMFLGLVMALLITVVPIGGAYATTKLIPDAALERAIKKELEFSGTLTRVDLLFLTSLSVSGQNIRSLSGLQFATNLSSLNISKNAIRDLSPIANLQKLTTLNVSGNQVKALCPSVGKLINLTTLNASDNFVETLTCFDKLSNLQKLQLGDNLISDITPLALFNGKHIELTDNEIRDLSPAEAWENVTHVYLANNPLDKSNDPLVFTMRRAGALVDLENAYNIQVYNGKDRLAFNVAPFQSSGTTLVEFRPIFTKLGLTIQYDAATKTITGNKKGLTVVLKIGNRFASVNGQFKTLNLAPQINKGVTMVPLRLIAEASGQEVSWNAFSRTIFIGSQQEQILRVIEKSNEYYSTYNLQGFKSLYDSTFLRYYELDNEIYTFYDTLLQLNADFEKTIDAYEIVEMKPGQAVVETVHTVKVIAREDSASEMPPPVTNTVVTTLRKNNNGMWMVVEEKKTVVTEQTNPLE